MNLPLYEQVAALLTDYPEQGLLTGDVVTRVESLESPGADLPNGYYVEAFNALGETIAVFTGAEQDLEALTARNVLSKRTLQVV